jgi:hypothetical protein
VHNVYKIWNSLFKVLSIYKYGASAFVLSFCIYVFLSKYNFSKFSNGQGQNQGTSRNALVNLILGKDKKTTARKYYSSDST